MKNITKLVAMAATSAFITGANAQVVYSNNAGGDAFAVTGSGMGTVRDGQAIGSSDWYYNNVGSAGGGVGGGIAGIDTVNPRSGNGSAHIQVSNGGKADLEYYGSAVKATMGGDLSFGPDFATSLGKFQDLTAMSYDWFRASSDLNSVAAPALRLRVTDNISAPTVYGYIVFEPYENGFPTITDGVWNSTDILGSNWKGWGTGNIPGGGQANLQTMSTWMTNLGSYDVLGFSVGMGSSNGTADSFIDNVGFGFSGNNTVHNFEAVPEPASMIALGMGAFGMLRKRRAKKA